MESSTSSDESFLREGAERREQLAGEIGPTPPPPSPRPSPVVGQGWLYVALLAGRTLGCLLMMTGVGACYSLNTWVTGSDVVLGFPMMFLAAGVLLLDPWDVVEELWPYANGWLNGERVSFTWSFTSRDTLHPPHRP